MGPTPRLQPSRFKAKRVPGAMAGRSVGAGPSTGAGLSTGAGPSARIDEHPHERATYSAISKHLQRALNKHAFQNK